MRLAYLVGHYPPSRTRSSCARCAGSVRAESRSRRSRPPCEPRPALTEAERGVRQHLHDPASAVGGAGASACARAFATGAGRLHLDPRPSPSASAARACGAPLAALLLRRGDGRLAALSLGSAIRHLHAQFTNQVTDVALLVARYEGSARPRMVLELHRARAGRVLRGLALQSRSQGASGPTSSSASATSPAVNSWRSSRSSTGARSRSSAAGSTRLSSNPCEGRRNGDATEILCIGRLVAVKGQALVIEARLDPLEPRARRPGDDRRRRSDQGRLEALAAKLGVGDRIAFTGAVGQDRIRELYAAADVFCLPSFAEGVPVVLMEAMAMEVPVVTSRIMGIPELVEDGVNGLLIAPGDVAGLDAALERLARDPGRASPAREGGAEQDRRRVRARHLGRATRAAVRGQSARLARPDRSSRTPEVGLGVRHVGDGEQHAPRRPSACAAGGCSSAAGAGT